MLYGEISDRARQLQDMLQKAYERVTSHDISASEQRNLEKQISQMEAELSLILDNRVQAVTPGGYYTDEGVKRATGSVTAMPALVLAGEAVEKKIHPLPWIVISLVAAAALYYTIRR